MSQERRIAVVTGGTGALGGPVVGSLVKAGWRVHVPWRNREDADALEERSGDGSDRLRLAPADLTDAGSVDGFFSGVRVEDGRVDLLCNLVGGFAMGSVEDTDPSTWRRMLELNATTAFLCARAALPLLRESGAGAVVNVAALPALEREASGMAAYAAGKSALTTLTRSLASELRGEGITVNAVAPEIIDTPANREAMPDADRSTWLDPGDIARVILFLAGPDARIVTGSVLVLARGET